MVNASTKSFLPGQRPVTKKTMWSFAMGQMGWEICAGIISSWLVYYFLPSTDLISEGQAVYIPQGYIFWVFTVVGLITFGGRIFDAITDPLIASWSDNFRSKFGRRIPFMTLAALPLAIVTCCIFIMPNGGITAGNVAYLACMLILFYLFLTFYCTPYNALMAELGKTQDNRLYISTAISFTYIVGCVFGYAAPYIWGLFISGGMERMTAIKLTFGILSVVALICMLVPCLTIKETDYVVVKENDKKVNTFKSLASTFKNKDFRVFVLSDVAYWIGLTLFQTGMGYFVTSLLNLAEAWSTYLTVIMTAISVCCYPLVGKFSKKFGKRKMVIFAFFMFAFAFGFAALSGKLGIPNEVHAVLIAVFAAVPMAILGILPQSMVADIAEEDTIKTGEKREGMFYAARTFAFKIGQSVALLMFSSLALIGQVSDDKGNVISSNGWGYRIALIVAMAFVILGAVALWFYNEKRVMTTIQEGHKLEAKENLSTDFDQDSKEDK